MGFVLPDLVRVVVAIDPAASSGEDADETGIIVAGKDKDSRGYVLADLSGHYMPLEWAKIAVAAYKNHGADRVVAEINNGGEMVEATLRVVDDNLAYTGVHATRGKVVRAEPVAALYEQGRIRHMGAFTVLEDQMCEFTPDLDRSKPKRDPTDPSSRGMGGEEPYISVTVEEHKIFHFRIAGVVRAVTLSQYVIEIQPDLDGHARGLVLTERTVSVFAKLGSARNPEQRALPAHGQPRCLPARKEKAGSTMLEL